MPDSDSHRAADGTALSRRQVLQTAAGAGTLGVAGCLGGGGSTPTSGGSATVEISGNKNFKNNLDTQAFYEAGVPEDIEINLTAGPEETGDRAKAYASALDAGEPKPDILMTDNGWTIPFIVRGDLLNLSKNLSDSYLSTVRKESFDSLIKTSQHPKTGKLYALPFFIDYPTMQYRKDLFRSAGVADDAKFKSWSTDPPSWSEWSSLVAEVHGASDVDYGYVWQGADYGGLPCCSFLELMVGQGGAYFGGIENAFGPVGKRPVTVTSPEVKEAVAIGWDLVHEDEKKASADIAAASPTEVYGWTEPDTDGQFTDSRNAVAMRNWSYTVGIAQENWKDFSQLGTMPMPKGPQGSVSALGGWLVSVNPNTKNLDATLKVLKAMTSEPVQKAKLNGPGFLPSKPKLMKKSWFKNHPAFGPHADTYAAAGQNTRPRPVTKVWPQQSTAIASNVNDAFQGEKTIDTAMSDLEQKLKALEGAA